MGSWWVEDMSQQCYKGYHKGWALGLGIPLTLLFCVCLPFGGFAFMWRSHKQGRLQDVRFEKHYTALCSGIGGTSGAGGRL